MPGPLDGIRIVDLTGVVSGPFATLHLAAMRNEVLRRRIRAMRLVAAQREAPTGAAPVPQGGR